eukprot:TRINITY_DN11491_c0_g1_i1.p1 TRINITY_DN11491_c0_g1~~TRINITY_DN11491_c0_g1_i1.p1  ORF type:complete len:1597 (+),score=334.78 TRINITY_DN11491_c0_g1_i1:59-4849(+)
MSQQRTARSLHHLPRLPPQLPHNPIYGTLTLSLGTAKWSPAFQPPTSAEIVAKWWGDPGPTVILQLRNTSSPHTTHNTTNTHAATATFTVCTSPNVFLRYLTDMKHLPIDLVDSKSHACFGTCHVTFKGFSERSPIKRSFPMFLSADPEFFIGDLFIYMSLSFFPDGPSMHHSIQLKKNPTQVGALGSLLERAKNLRKEMNRALNDDHDGEPVNLQSNEPRNTANSRPIEHDFTEHYSSFSSERLQADVLDDLFPPPTSYPHKSITQDEPNQATEIDIPHTLPATHAPDSNLSFLVIIRSLLNIHARGQGIRNLYVNCRLPFEDAVASTTVKWGSNNPIFSFSFQKSIPDSMELVSFRHKKIVFEVWDQIGEHERELVGLTKISLDNCFLAFRNLATWPKSPENSDSLVLICNGLQPVINILHQNQSVGHADIFVAVGSPNVLHSLEAESLQQQSAFPDESQLSAPPARPWKDIPPPISTDRKEPPTEIEKTGPDTHPPTNPATQPDPSDTESIQSQSLSSSSRSPPEQNLTIRLHVIRASGLQTCLAQLPTRSAQRITSRVGVNPYIIFYLRPDIAKQMGQQNQPIYSHTLTNTFCPVFHFSHDIVIPSTPTSLAALAGGVGVCEVWHRFTIPERAGSSPLAEQPDLLIGTTVVRLSDMLQKENGVHGWKELISEDGHVVGALELQCTLEPAPQISLPPFLINQDPLIALITINIEQIIFGQRAKQTLPSELGPSSMIQFSYKFYNEERFFSNPYPIELSNQYLDVQLTTIFRERYDQDLVRFLREDLLEVNVYLMNDQLLNKKHIGFININMSPLIDDHPKKNSVKWVGGIHQLLADESSELPDCCLKLKVFLRATPRGAVMVEASAMTEERDDIAIPPSSNDRPVTPPVHEEVQTSLIEDNQPHDEANVVADEHTTNHHEEILTQQYLAFEVEIERAANLPLVFSPAAHAERIPPHSYVTLSWHTGELASPPRTPTIQNSSSPTWHSTLFVQLPITPDVVEKIKNYPLCFRVWHNLGEDPTGMSSWQSLTQKQDDQILGCAQVDLNPLFSGLHEINGWYHIVNFRQQQTGQLKIRVTPCDRTIFVGDSEKMNECDHPHSATLTTHLPQIGVFNRSYDESINDLPHPVIESLGLHAATDGRSHFPDADPWLDIADDETASKEELFARLKKQLQDLDDFQRRAKGDIPLVEQYDHKQSEHASADLHDRFQLPPIETTPSRKSGNHPMAADVPTEDDLITITRRAQALLARDWDSFDPSPLDEFRPYFSDKHQSHSKSPLPPRVQSPKGTPHSGTSRAQDRLSQEMDHDLVEDGVYSVSDSASHISQAEMDEGEFNYGPPVESPSSRRGQPPKGSPLFKIQDKSPQSTRKLEQDLTDDEEHQDNQYLNEQVGAFHASIIPKFHEMQIQTEGLEDSLQSDTENHEGAHDSAHESDDESVSGSELHHHVAAIHKTPPQRPKDPTIGGSFSEPCKPRAVTFYDPEEEQRWARIRERLQVAASYVGSLTPEGSRRIQDEGCISPPRTRIIEEFPRSKSNAPPLSVDVRLKPSAAHPEAKASFQFNEYDRVLKIFRSADHRHDKDGVSNLSADSLCSMSTS